MDMTEELENLFCWLINERLRAIAHEMLAEAKRDRDRTESPIEAVMLERLKFFDPGYGPILTAHPVRFAMTFEEAVKDACGATEQGNSVYIYPQCLISPYRVDFLLVLKDGEDFRAIAVECDGHDFHEKTREQVARDKKRDRALLSLGVPVFRFSGSEIWARNHGLLAEITDYALVWFLSK
jgi:very-short-patch-repair endonuclease